MLLNHQWAKGEINLETNEKWKYHSNKIKTILKSAPPGIRKNKGNPMLVEGRK